MDCNTIAVRGLNDPLQPPLQVRSPPPVTSHSSLQCLQNNVSKHDFKLCSLNVRSINNKTLCIREFIIDNNLDILFLCETWLGTDYDETSISEFLPPGYKRLHQARTNQRGGGVGIVYKGGLDGYKLLHQARTNQRGGGVGIVYKGGLDVVKTA